MGIHGIYKEIGPGERIALAKVAADHYIAHNRPFRLAIDISIWLFQIQAGKGGSNPALRTFYYRLLRLMSLSIHPLFVFDGPNKPLFKRNKRVGGPGVRVASVPEFLAKQLLKQFGFPLHVAPGEAEAECALLQRKGIVDGVLSEDVDTLMFGSGLTLKNWTSENSSKSPTHVNLYRAEETKEKSGLDRNGMVLVALMSGGDYIPEGIPGCGPKVACDAARAGFGGELCALGKKDSAGLKAWKERLQHEIRTNESKFFSRRNTTIVIPEDFPNAEVFGYYTHPCVSTGDKLQKLRDTLRWDQDIDFQALRGFTGEAFDWRCIGGAMKFIKNLAPAMLVRSLRLRGENSTLSGLANQAGQEDVLVSAIHGKRNHDTVGNILEYRVSFTPVGFVPIDLSIEEEDDEFTAAGVPDDSDAESEPPDTSVPSSTQSPTKKRVFKPYHPDLPEKLWVPSIFLQLGCPLLVEDYEAGLLQPKAGPKASKKGKGRGKAADRSNTTARDPQENALLRYAQVTKPAAVAEREVLQSADVRKNMPLSQRDHNEAPSRPTAVFKLPSTQLPAGTIPPAGDPFAPTQPRRPPAASQSRSFEGLPVGLNKPATTPKVPGGRKRPPAAFSSPASSQKSIASYFSPTTRRTKAMKEIETIDLLSSSPVRRSLSFSRQAPSPPHDSAQRKSIAEAILPALPDTVTKRRKKAPLKRWQTEPVRGAYAEDKEMPETAALPDAQTPRRTVSGNLHQSPMDLISPSPARSDCSLASPSTFISRIPEPPSFGPPSRGTRARSAEDMLEPPDDLSRPSPATVPQPSAPAGPAEPTLPKTTDPPTEPIIPTNPPPRKTHIKLRQSLAGAWQEVGDADMLDLTGDGSGWKASKGQSTIVGLGSGGGGAASGGGIHELGGAAAGGGRQTRSGGRGGLWRKSGVEVLDLTGA